jgi:hypothetical protein
MPYLIDNYRPEGRDLSSAEFIKKTAGALSITKTHGLGSGVYGLEHGTKTMRAGKEILTTHELVNPVLLDTNEKSELFIEFTQYFNDLIEKYINGALKGAAVTESLDAKKVFLDRVFSELFPRLVGDAKTHVLRVIKAFSAAYKGAAVGDFLWQPINYLLMPVYGGIFNSSEAGNTLDRGSVLFVAIQPRHQKQAFNREGAFVPEGRKLVKMGGYGKRKSKSRRTSKLTLGTKRANRKYIAK